MSPLVTERKRTRTRIQRDILKAHGVIVRQGGGLKPRKLSDHRKGLTTVMRLLESRYGKDIEDLISLDRGSIYDVATYLDNAVSPTTITRWRHKLGIDNAEEN